MLLAHHGAEAPALLIALLTFGGPALLALRCWIWERTHKDDNEEHRH